MISVRAILSMMMYFHVDEAFLGSQTFWRKVDASRMKGVTAKKSLSAQRKTAKRSVFDQAVVHVG